MDTARECRACNSCGPELVAYPTWGAVRMPGYRLVEERFVVFEQELPTVCRARQLHVQDLTFLERRTLVFEWSRGIKGRPKNRGADTGCGVGREPPKFRAP